MNKAVAQKIFSKARLGNVICSPERVYGGLLHKMYKVKSSSGDYAVKAFNPKVMERKGVFDNLIFAEEIARVAYENDAPSVPAICDTSSLHKIDGAYYMVFEWIEAKKITENEVTLYHCKKIGEVLAKLHNINYESRIRAKRTRMPLLDIEWEKYFKNDSKSEVSKYIKNNQQKLYEWSELVNHSAVMIFDDVINHNDMDVKNVLWDKDNLPIIIDWEAAGYSNRLLALVNVAVDWSHAYSERFIKSHFASMIKSYADSGGCIDGDIKAVLNYNYKGLLDWFEYSVKRSLGIESNDAEEKELGEKQVFSTMQALMNYENNLPEIVKLLKNIG